MDFVHLTFDVALGWLTPRTERRTENQDSTHAEYLAEGRSAAIILGCKKATSFLETGLY